MGLLLDTNIIIALLDPRHRESVVGQLAQETPGSVVTSVIVAYELHFGAARSSRPGENRQRLDAVLAELPPPAGEALLRTQQSLARDGLGLVVLETYGLGSAAMPGADPAHEAQHVRGGAVDVQLTDPLTGETLAMPSPYRDPTSRAHADWPGSTSRQRWYRSRLRRAMESAGFTAHERAWWHFDFAVRRDDPAGNVLR